MPGTVIHRGAVPERLAREGDEQCESLCPWSLGVGKPSRQLRCVYVEGHEGPHYCSGEIWGNARVHED